MTEWEIRSTRAWRLFFVTVVLRVMLFPVSGLPVSSARVDDCGGYDPWHYGAVWVEQDNVSGAQADIDVTSAPVCRTHPTGAVAYSMMTATSSDGYAQIGWGRFIGVAGPPSCSTGCTAFFWQTLKNGASQPVDDYFQVYGTPGGPGVGQSFGFKVDWHNGASQDQHIHLVITDCADSGASCGDWHETNFDPSVQWTGRHAEYSGETLDGESDMPGVSTDTTNFDNIQVRTGLGTYARATPLTKCNASPPPHSGSPCGTAPDSGGGTYNNYNFAWVSTRTDGHFRIWTG